MFFKSKKQKIQECKEKYPLLFDENNYIFVVASPQYHYFGANNGLKHKVTRDDFPYTYNVCTGCIRFEMPNHVSGTLSNKELNILQSHLYSIYKRLKKEYKKKYNVAFKKPKEV